MELLDLYRFLLSGLAAGQRGDERVHHRRRWWDALAKPHIPAAGFAGITVGRRSVEPDWVKCRQVAAKCRWRSHILAADGPGRSRRHFMHASWVDHSFHSG